jgi:hypothetical protein
MIVDIRRLSNHAGIVPAVMALVCWASPATPARAQGPPGAPPATNSVAPSPLAPFVIQNVTVHDPSTIVQCKDEFWVFYTGRGLPSYHSKDLVKWERGPAVFTNAPGWVAENVPANRPLDYWAPGRGAGGGQVFFVLFGVHFWQKHLRHRPGGQ